MSLVASLNHESTRNLMIVAGVILILGFAYWLISRSERDRYAIKGTFMNYYALVTGYKRHYNFCA